MKLTPPPERTEAYVLHGGGYDGSTFACGPGGPYLPPFSITLEESADFKERGKMRFVYEFDQNLSEDAPPCYRMVREEKI